MMTPCRSSASDAARFAVGIDLGTTHSAVAFVDLEESGAPVRILPLLQTIAPGETAALDVLPSFAYAPATGEWSDGRAGFIVGRWARDRGAQVPGRLIASAKSWLCHPGVDRQAAILPWHGAPDAPRISPVAAQSLYLAHIRACWDQQYPAHPLAAQELVITIPASFDEAARRLTLQAAAKAGLGTAILMEEPQAAFYAWLESGAADGQPGKIILVCDVGGGTTDFTLIAAQTGADGIRYRRLAVGEHLLLGGDNMDMALARQVEETVRARGGRTLDGRAWGLLLQSCRAAKECLLGAAPPVRAIVRVAGGARLVGGATLEHEVTGDEIRGSLLAGFFPETGPDAAPNAASGFQEFGLPYAADPAITRHLAAFLRRHTPADGVLPDTILFNGGVFEAPVFRERLLAVLNGWRLLRQPDAAPMRVLANERLDLAVARGAAYFAALRKRGGQRIAASLARAYYIAANRKSHDNPTVVCLAPAGLAEGDDCRLSTTFRLRIREPAEFTLYYSGTRLADSPGAVLNLDPDQMTALPPLRTVIRSGGAREAAEVEVRLRTRLNEIGTLDIVCEELRGNRAWKLEFDVRGQARSAGRMVPAGETGVTVDEALLHAARQAVQRVFAPRAPGDPDTLAKTLEMLAGLPRNEWPLPLLRELWAQLMESSSGRDHGVLHEARWLNLTGFCLRPGYGYPVDDWRVEQTWRLFRPGTRHPRNELCRAEWWILWRRVAGGLAEGRQRQLLDPLQAMLREISSPSGSRAGPHECAEMLRLLGALEWTPAALKLEIGEMLCRRMEKGLPPPLQRAAWWALGRLGARVPAYGPLNTVVPPEAAAEWVGQMRRMEPPHAEALFSIVQMARLTRDRHRDLDTDTRASVLEWLAARAAPEHVLRLVREGDTLTVAEEEAAAGDSLPPGLRLVEE